MLTKVCCICEEVKPATSEFFHKRSSKEDGFRCDCKECRKFKRKKNYNKESKVCLKCKTLYLNTEEFFNKSNKGIESKTRSHCKACFKEQSRKNHLSSKYKLTPEKLEEIYLKQNGKCSICKLVFDKLVVDHCHVTNKVRALLCDNCNTGIGMLKENIEYLYSAIDYINKYNKKTN